MTVLNFILNCAGLLLWLNWWSGGMSAPRASGIALVSNLRRAGPVRRDRWRSPVALVVILLARALLYRQIGPAMQWFPQLSLGPIALVFRSDEFPRMLSFSLLSFAVFSAGFYFCALLVSAAMGREAVGNPWDSFVRALLGPLGRMPALFKMLAPFFVAMLFWLGVAPLLSVMGVQAPVHSFMHLSGQAALVGVSAFISWQHVIIAALVLAMVNSYVYLGRAPLWPFVNTLSRSLLRPLSMLPLRLGKFDLVPLLALAVVLLVAEMLERLLPWLHLRLPL